MEQNKKDQSFAQQPGKKPEVGQKAPATTRPEIDLPLKGGRSDADLANKGAPRRDDRSTERSDSDKKSVR